MTTNPSPQSCLAFEIQTVYVTRARSSAMAAIQALREYVTRLDGNNTVVAEGDVPSCQIVKIERFLHDYCMLHGYAQAVDTFTKSNRE